MVRKIRLTLATIFFVCITLMFLDFTGVTHTWFSWMAKLQFLPAVLALNAGVIILLIALTLLFGRIYCSVICPMGVFQDIIAWLGKKARPKKERKIPYTYSKAKSALRYSVLGVFIVWAHSLHCSLHTVLMVESPATSSSPSTAGATTC